MDINSLQKNFGRMGARLVVSRMEGRFRPAAGIDVGRDNKGEFFDIRVEPNVTTNYSVVDVDERVRHLLLLARDEDNRKNKFLCGHDERHWFVCAVPGNGIARVRDAIEALQPAEVRLAVNSQVKRAKHRLRRRNEAFVRQGEWFFLPSPELVVNPKLVMANEPISRGNGGKAHWCQFLYRTGGRAVMVCNRHPAGISPERYNEILAANPHARLWNWRAMRRDASVFVRGTVRHPDHKTITLDPWHQVLMNTEAQAPGAGHVVFLD